MKNSRPFFARAILALLFPLISVPFSIAETIELVTYYPAPGNTGDQHARSLTVGTAYNGVTPPDGQALFVGPVGIGTAAPQMDLEVYRQDESYVRIWGTGINAAPENFAALELGSDLPADRVVDRIWQIAHKRGGAGGLNDFHINYFDGAAWSTKVAIQPGGNVGIGTAAPGYKLEVRANNAYGIVTSDGTAITGMGTDAGPNGFVGTRTNHIMRVVANNGTGEIWLTPAGRVGINNQNPQVFLDVAQNNAIRVGDTYVSSGNAPPNRWAHFGINAWFRGDQWIYTNPGQGISLVQLMNDSIHFYTNANSTDAGWADRLSILANGRVGIGTTVPAQQLDVAGGVRFSRAGQDNGGLLWAGAPGNFGGREVVLTVGDGAGNDTDEIWLGCNTGAFRGQIQLNGAHTYVRGTEINPPSDGRLKTGVTPISGALERVAVLRGVNFHWKDPGWDKRLKMGLVAQEVESVFPELVSADPEGIKTVDYPMLTAALVEAVKELKHQNEAQQREIEVLKKRLPR